MVDCAPQVIGRPLAPSASEQTEQLEAKKLEMPFVPTISNPLDRSKFDELEEDDEGPALKWKEFIDPEHEGMWASEFGPLESRT